MPIAISTAMPAADKTKTVVGQKKFIAILPAGGAQKNFRVRSLSISRTSDKIENEEPDESDGGVLVPNRTVTIRKKTSIKVVMREIKSDDAMIFVNNAQVTGTARFWVGDPADAVDTFAFVSNEFAATAAMEGELSFTSDNFAELTVNIDVNGAFDLEVDADVGA